MDVEDHVSERARQYFQIPGQRGRQKGEIEADTLPFEAVDGSRRSYFPRQLRKGGQGSGPSNLAPHKPEYRAVDADQPRHRLVGAGPMLGRLIGQIVAHRPDAEIGIVRN